MADNGGVAIKWSRLYTGGLVMIFRSGHFTMTGPEVVLLTNYIFFPTVITLNPKLLNEKKSTSLKTGTKRLYNFIWPPGIVLFF